MTFVWIIVGAFVGAIVSNGDLPGFIFGGLLGWLFARQGKLDLRLRQIERQSRVESVRQAAATAPREAPASAAQPAARPPDEASAIVEAAPQPAASEAVAARAEAASETPSETSSEVPPSIPPSRASERDPWEPAAARVAAAEAVPQRPVIKPPEGSDFVQRGVEWLKRWFTEGNVPVKLGVPVLFFGVAYFLRYAASQGWVEFTPERRAASVAIAGVAALIFAWRQRQRQRVFSLSLQGGALGILLLDVFASFRYELVPALPAFVMVLVLVVGCGVLAVLQNAIALAVLGIAGGFLAPVLISTGSGNHVALFSYYAVLNAMVLAVAWVRPWRVLNLLGFAFTFVISSMWGWRYYQPQHFATTEPFLILFFLFYVAISVLYALRREQAGKGIVDGSLVFGVPLVAFGLQSGLLYERPMALAMSALIASGLYATLAWSLRSRASLQTLVMAFVALAAGFATISVPLALDADLTAAVWAIEGAGVFWLSLRQGSVVQRVAALALMAVGLCAWFLALVDAQDGTLMRNAVFWAGLIQACALGFAAWCWQASGRSGPLAPVLLGVGAVVWSITLIHEVDEHVVYGWRRAASIYAWAGSFLAWALIARRKHWSQLGFVAVLALVLSLPWVLTGFGHRMLEGREALAWLAWIGSAFVALTALREPRARGLSWAHVSVLFAVAALVSHEGYEWLRDAGYQHTAWGMVCWMLPLLFMLHASERWPRFGTPLQGWFPGYRLRWQIPAGLLLIALWVISLGHSGDATPLPYVTLFNPLELTQLACVLVVYLLASARVEQAPLRLGVAIVLWVWLSYLTARSVHHYLDLPWDSRLWQTASLQMALTLLWGLLGASAWVIGSRRVMRPVWIAGAALLALVLVKLVLIDRRYMGDMAGIVSVLAFGAMLVVVGYLAPSPPSKKEQANEPE
ncbi:MAG: DUF2339 domain-containing protein [Xanthomonadales bacterium]|nr:DUF2339 domain-containing protein [Xanthomonadales bacterium]